MVRTSPSPSFLDRDRPEQLSERIYHLKKVLSVRRLFRSFFRLLRDDTWTFHEIYVDPLQLELGIPLKHSVHVQTVLVRDYLPKLRDNGLPVAWDDIVYTKIGLVNARGLTFAPTLLPHWPICTCTISRIFSTFGLSLPTICHRRMFVRFGPEKERKEGNSLKRHGSTESSSLDWTHRAHSFRFREIRALARQRRAQHRQRSIHRSIWRYNCSAHAQACAPTRNQIPSKL